MTFAEIKQRVWERLDNSPAPVAYTVTETDRAINRGLRLFAFLTLSVERTAPFPVSAGISFYSPIAAYPDWIAPLRMVAQTGLDYAGQSVFAGQAFGAVPFGDQTLIAPGTPYRLRPAALNDLDARDAGWQNAAGAPLRYGTVGFGVLYLDRQPTSDIALWHTYAGFSRPLVNPDDVPEIPDNNHHDLIDFAIYAVRLKHGGEQLAKAQPYLKRFLGSAQELAGYVRARSKSLGYETLPAELTLADLSRLGGKK